MYISLNYAIIYANLIFRESHDTVRGRVSASMPASCGAGRPISASRGGTHGPFCGCGDVPSNTRCGS